MGGGTLHGAFDGTQGGNQSKGVSKSRKKLIGSPGDVNETKNRHGKIVGLTKIGADGRATKERHFVNSGNHKKHSIPHDHIITWSANGNPVYSDPINYKPGGVPDFK